MNELTQEALSRKYSPEMVLLLRLENGTIAGFNAARKLIGVYPNIETAFNEVQLNKPVVLVEPAPRVTTEPIEEAMIVELDLDKYNL